MDFFGFGDEAIAAFLVFTLGVLFTIIWQRVSEKKRRIVYKTLIDTMKVDINNDIKDRLSIFVDSYPVKSLHMYRVTVENNGNLAINNQILLFEFDSNSEYLLPADVKHKPLVGPVEKVEEIETPYQVKYNVKLFGVGQSIEFIFFTKDNSVASLTVHGRNETQPETEIIGQSGQRSSKFTDNLQKLTWLIILFLLVSLSPNTFPANGLTVVFIQLAFLVRVILLIPIYLTIRDIIEGWPKSEEKQESSDVNIHSIEGSILNIKSTRPSSTIASNFNSHLEDKTGLQPLIEELRKSLKQAPIGYDLEVNRITSRLDTLLNEISQEKPDKEIITFTMKSLMRSARELSTVMPIILVIMEQISDRVVTLGS